MLKLLSHNGNQEFGDFKLTILGMLRTYDFERRILVRLLYLVCYFSSIEIGYLTMLSNLIVLSVVFLHPRVGVSLRLYHLTVVCWGKCYLGHWDKQFFSFGFKVKMNPKLKGET